MISAEPEKKRSLITFFLSSPSRVSLIGKHSRDYDRCCDRSHAVDTLSLMYTKLWLWGTGSNSATDPRADALIGPMLCVFIASVVLPSVNKKERRRGEKEEERRTRSGEQTGIKSMRQTERNKYVASSGKEVARDKKVTIRNAVPVSYWMQCL